ncbi:metalloprotease family protein [Fictibacillus sp. JL2B1089]|uniref:metalloprotease family protein n=1 Tax=Fictibacillus sp. JL2B1089 TaxID=3399565 RepID=UPI003A8ABC2B
MKDNNRIKLKDNFKEKLFKNAYAVIILAVGISIILLRANNGSLNNHPFLGIRLDSDLVNLYGFLLIILIITIPGTIILTYFHELIHRSIARKLGYIANFEVVINWKKLKIKEAVCHFGKEETIQRNKFVLILMGPLITFFSLSFIIFFIENFLLSVSAMFLIALKLIGCSGDLLMFIQAMKKTSREDSLKYDGNKSFTIIKG